MDFSRNAELLEGIVNQLIDEEALGVCFEMHRAIRLGYYDLLYHDRYHNPPTPFTSMKPPIKGLPRSSCRQVLVLKILVCQTEWSTWT